VTTALRGAGIAADLADAAFAAAARESLADTPPGTDAAEGDDDPAMIVDTARAMAQRYARRRGFGPYRRATAVDPARQRQRELAAMVRAGHSFADACAVLDGPDD
jgi:predicted GNAT family acetyltransferase